MTRFEIAAKVAEQVSRRGPFEVELVKGEGYWYFTATLKDADGKVIFYETHSEYTMYLSDYDAGRWVRIGEDFIHTCNHQLQERVV